MKRILVLFLPIFGIIYLLFFAIPFPMIIYYSSEYDSSPPALLNQDPVTALVVLACSVALWLILIMGYFHNWILSVFRNKRNMDRLKSTGISRQAEIISAEKISSPNAKQDSYTLKLAFKNLMDTPIQQNLLVNDGKAYERRFQNRNKVEVLIDPQMRAIPCVILASTESRINWLAVTLRVLCWLLVIALVVYYYLYAYQHESYGYGWRFLGFTHPLFVCPVILFVYKIGAQLLKKYTTRLDEKLVIKYKGIQTKARVMSVSETGTYINDQPKMKFDLSYTDQRGQQHRTSINKVISILNLDMTKQEELDIFYLPEDPKRIAFVRDIHDLT